MRLVTVAGPPSAGKTSVILKTVEHLKACGLKTGIVKFDCMRTMDDETYERHDIPVKVGLAGNLCPDHFFIINIEDCLQWGIRSGLDLLISESAGLCNRCSPHINDVLAVCVIDNLSGINTPGKIGPMLRFADIVVVTKGDIVSQAEREVFYSHIHKVNPRARIMLINGITGQGSQRLARAFADEQDIQTLLGGHLRYSMSSGLCSYCLGQTLISEKYSSGNLRKMTFEDQE